MCGGYDGTGTIAWAPPPGGQASLAAGSFGENSNVNTQKFDGVISTFDFFAGGPVGTALCDADAHLVLSGPPVAGKTYHVVDGTMCDATITVNGGADVACLQLQGFVVGDGGDCHSASALVFASTASMATVAVQSVTKVAGDTNVAITASGVPLAAVPSSGTTGALTLQLNVTAQCFYGL
jgi:hypothetical protein